MKKRVVFFPAIVGIVLLLGSCVDILSPPEDRGVIPLGKGRLAVSVENPRTALPTGTFDTYVLRFNYTGPEGYTHANVDWSSGPLNVDLEPGSWTVYLDAYAGPAVSGTGSAVVTVDAGTVTTVTIAIGINTGAGTGTLKYKVSYPDVDANHDYGTHTLTVRNADGTAVGNPEIITNGVEGFLPLGSGIYLVSVVIEDTIQRTGVTRTSVAHIYGGKETSLEFNIAANEFTAQVPLTVTANLTVPTDVTVSSRKISVYSNAEGTTAIPGTEKTLGHTDLDSPAEFALWIPSIYETVYLRQEIVIDGVTLDGQTEMVNINPEQAVTAASLNDTAYTVNIAAGIIGGTVEVNTPAAFQGNTVIITLTDGADGKLDDRTVKYNDDNDGTDTPVTGPPYEFTMPASEVTVSAEFKQFVRYVTVGGTGNGKSWATASGDVQKMMDELEALFIPAYSGDYIVKLGAGTYKPQYEPMIPALPGNYAYNDTPGDFRDRAFILREGVKVWGGYPASGGADADRNIISNVTILSGDFNGNDIVTGSGSTLNIMGNDDNAYHVVLAIGIPANSGTALDGLRITGGNADDSRYAVLSLGGAAIESYGGGGIYNEGSSLTLNNVMIFGNYAEYYGGGVYDYGNASPVLTNVTISCNYAEGGGGIYNEASSLTLTNVTVSGNYANDGGGGIFSIAGAGTTFTMTLTDVDISGNKAAGGSGGGIYSESNSDYPSTLTMTGGTISGNEASGDGGGIYNMYASLGKNGGEISDNTASRSGGGIYNMSDGDPCTLTLTGVIISDNGASVSGGGIYNDGSSLVMNGGEISGNEAVGSTPYSGRGGGIYNNNSSLTLAAVDITNNTASGSGATATYSGYGGGIYSFYSSLTLDDNVCITNNTATGSAANSGRGGGMYNDQMESLVMNSGEISDNDADGEGGGMYIKDGPFYMQGGTIARNEAVNGGGVYMDGGDFTMSGTAKISGNEVTSGQGGGVYVVDGAAFEMTENAEISNNTASDSGGGVYVYHESSFNMEGGAIITGNRSGSSGGGVHVGYDSTFTMSGGTISGNNAAGEGGGVYMYDGTFTKSGGGTIFGDTDNFYIAGSNENTSSSGDGHAVYLNPAGATKKKDDTVLPNLNLYAHHDGTTWIYVDPVNVDTGPDWE